MSTFVKGDRAVDKVGVYAFVHAEDQQKGEVSLSAVYEIKAGERRRHTCSVGEIERVELEFLCLFNETRNCRLGVAIAPIARVRDPRTLRANRARGSNSYGCARGRGEYGKWIGASR